MMLAVALVAPLMVWLGVRLIQRASHGFAAAAHALDVRIRQASAITAGLVDVEGTISSRGAPILALSDVRCVAASTTLRSARGTGKARRALGERRRVEVARAALRDASGECELDLDHAEILGEPWVADEVPIASFEETAPAWARALVAEGATHVTVEERIIPEGARVLVSGRATALEAPAPGSAGDGSAAQRFRIEGSPERRLLLVFGGHRRFLLQAITPAVFGLLVGVYLCAFGVVAFAVAVSG